MYSESSQGPRASADIAVDMESASLLRSAVPLGLRPLASLAARRMTTVPAPLSAVPETFGRIAAASEAMAEVFAVLRRLARTDVTVTLIGETGTGKDVTAHAIHDASARAGGPFVVFDCGAVAPNLVESELFGH